MRSTSRCADCWTCLTLLAPPDPVSSAVGRARVVSLRGVLFPVFYQIIPTLYSLGLPRVLYNGKSKIVCLSEPPTSEATNLPILLSKRLQTVDAHTARSGNR